MQDDALSHPTVWVLESSDLDAIKMKIHPNALAYATRMYANDCQPLLPVEYRCQDVVA